MNINIIKNPVLFESLKQYNEGIINFSQKWSYNKPGEEYDFKNRKISRWFDPRYIRDLGLSRTYPDMCSIQYRPEYSLILHCSNYLSLFLINLLYHNKNTILIEDIGCGRGDFFYYLNKLGFNNFHGVDNWSQISIDCAKEFSKDFALNIEFNNSNAHPTIINNVGCAEFPIREINPNLELITIYTNRAHENLLAETMPNKGYKFLCRDTDDTAIAYCRQDKHKEFIERLKIYEA